LIACHESQTAGGKRYDVATVGRKRAHATFADARQVDRAESVELAVDMTTLMHGGDVVAFAQEKLARFAGDVTSRLERLWK
jgi:hypothetical protein